MEKIKQVGIIIAGTVMGYIGLLIAMPFLVSTANTSAIETANRSTIDAYTGAVGGIWIALWGLWFVPAALGIFCIVMVLRRD